MTSAWEGERVRLRAVEPSDLEAFVANDAETDEARAGWRVFPPRSAWAANEWIQQVTQAANDGDEFRLAIESRGSGEVVGMINTTLCDPHHGTCSYGIAIFPWAQRQGFGREAVTLVLRYLFGERRYQKCTVTVYGFNDVSLAFHRALGFQVEGRIRRARFAAGEYHDDTVLGITSEEFFQRLIG
jgi:RimJ/RimL family protein N-acetyltransferase